MRGEYSHLPALVVTPQGAAGLGHLGHTNHVDVEQLEGVLNIDQ